MQDYFEHFGIQGMKWGQKNGPPYPLSSDISTGRKLKIKKIKNAKNPSKLYKHRKEYTVEELEKHNRRYRAEGELYNHSDQYRKRGTKYVKGLVEAGTTAMALSALIKKVGDIKIPPELAEKILEEMK